MKEAEAEFQKAKELQPQAISYHTSISSRHPNRLVIDRNIDLPRIGRRVVAATPEREGVARGLWGMLWGPLPLDYGEAAAGAALFLFGMVYLFSHRISFLRNCERCGNIICSRCTRSRVIGSQCVQCLNAFSAKASADPDGLKRKRSQVARYQSSVLSFPRRISLVLPGMGHLIHGHSKEGFVILFIFALFLAQALLRFEGASAPVSLNPGWSWPWAGLTASLFLLFYLLVQHWMARCRSEGGKSHFRKP
jgi:hypothetical protein